MSRLTIVAGPKEGASIELPNGSFTLGSEGSRVDFALEGESVSSVHCRIAPLKGGGFGLQDLASSAGTFVNGERVTTVRLNEGDRIRVGAVEIRFGGAADPAPADAPAPASEDSVPSKSGLSARAIVQQVRAAESGRATEPDRTGEEIGGYKIESVLGRGGMGTVYRATQMSLHRTVALKVLSSQISGDPRFVDLFLREARAAARLHHPNVVTIHDVGSLGDVHYYSMELFEGGSVESSLRKQGRLGVETSLSIARDAARALEFAEEHGLRHRDVKPDNLMLTSRGVAKLADLGLAATTAEGSGAAFGTPHFVAPEQSVGASADHRADLYSLGATLFRMLTGRTVFQGATVQEILDSVRSSPPPRVRSLVEDVPEAVDDLVARLLQKDPAERPASAKEVVAAIDAILAPSVGGIPTRVLLAGGVGIAAVLGVAIFFALKGGEAPSTQPIVIVDTAETERVQREKDAMERQLAEQAAESAFLQTQLRGEIPALELAAAYDRVAAEHAGTDAAARAATEATRLRTADAEARRLAAERAALAAEFRDLLETAFATQIEANRYLEALALPPTIPGYEAALQDPEARSAIDAVPGRVASAAELRARELLHSAETALAESRHEDAQRDARKAKEILDRLVETSESSIAPTLLEGLRALHTTALQTLAQAGELKRDAETDRLRAAFLDAQRAVEASLGDLRAGDPSAALARLETLAAPGSPWHAAFAGARDDASAAVRLLADLRAAAAARALPADSIADPATGKKHRITALDADGVRLEGPSPSGEPTILVRWSDGPSVAALGALLRRPDSHDASLEMRIARAALLDAVASNGLALAGHQRAIRADAPLVAAPPALRRASLGRAREALAAARAAGAAEEEAAALETRVAAEERALALWHEGLEALSTGAFTGAETALASLLALEPSPVALFLASDGSTLVARGRKGAVSAGR